MQMIESLQPGFDRGTSLVYKYFPYDMRMFDVPAMVQKINAGIKGE